MNAVGSPLFGISRRIPPSNLQAEQALLGAMLANNKAYDMVSPFLQPDHFADAINGRIYYAIGRRIDAGKLADALTLKAEFEHSGVLDEVGGTTYLAKLLGAMVAVNTARDYGMAIHDCWVRRRQIEIGEQLVDNAFGADADLDASGVLALHEDDVALLREQVTLGTAAKPGITTIWDAFNEAVERAQSIKDGDVAAPLTTGLPAVDRMIGGGVLPDTLTYIIGAGGAGKTELSLQIAETIATEAFAAWSAGGKQGKCPAVLYIMLGNMTARQLGARTAARAAAMRLGPIRRGTIDLDQAGRLVGAGKAIVQMPMEISDTGPSTLGRVLGDIRRVARRRPVAAVFVDNFSDMLSVNPDKMFGTAIGITKALKEQGATAFNTSVFLLMHLNSSAETNKARTPRPGAADIPWGTKKDADFAFGVWRPVKYLDPNPPQRPAKKLSAEGDEMFAKWEAEWKDKREPWPIGIADVSEVVPMKLREEEDRASDVGTLRFDRNTHRFVDVETEKRITPSSLFEDPI